MFNLKDKLLAKGFVTKEQVENAEAKTANKKEKKSFLDHERNKALAQLKAANKNDQYAIIRKWVDINRKDKDSDKNLDCEKFFISTKDNQLSWLSLKKEIIEQIANGSLGVIAYMSNHGLTHAVVPRDIAEDVQEVFPEWLKVLNEKK